MSLSKKVKFSLLLILSFLLGSSGVVFGDNSITSLIEVVFNPLKLKVNNNDVNTDHLVFNGTTYVPLRAVAEMLNKQVEWNEEEKSVNIMDTKSSSTTGKMLRRSDFQSYNLMKDPELTSNLESDQSHTFIGRGNTAELLRNYLDHGHGYGTQNFQQLPLHKKEDSMKSLIVFTYHPDEITLYPEDERYWPLSYTEMKEQLKQGPFVWIKKQGDTVHLLLAAETNALMQELIYCAFESQCSGKSGSGSSGSGNSNNTASATGQFQKVDGRSGMLAKIAAKPENGFHHPYYLYLPQDMQSNASPARLFVVPNNSAGASNDLNFHDEYARKLILNQDPSIIARRLNVPMLVPVFPRLPELYTHQLNRATMTTHMSGYERVDLQLIAMIKDAKALLKSNGVQTHDQIFMDGFSASAKFVTRFTAMHPELVKAASSGGHGGLPFLPINDANGETLRYPIGLSDFKQISGTEFDAEAFKKVAQYLYMGGDDKNDAWLHADVIDPVDTQQITRLWGNDLMKRWDMSKSVYAKLGYDRTQFATYPGVAHSYSTKIVNDIVAFFEANK